MKGGQRSNHLFLQNFSTIFHQVRLLGLRGPDGDFIIFSVRHCGHRTPCTRRAHRAGAAAPQKLYFLLLLLLIFQQSRERERETSLEQAAGL